MNNEIFADGDHLFIPERKPMSKFEKAIDDFYERSLEGIKIMTEGYIFPQKFCPTKEMVLNHKFDLILTPKESNQENNGVLKYTCKNACKNCGNSKTKMEIDGDFCSDCRPW